MSAETVGTPLEFTSVFDLPTLLAQRELPNAIFQESAMTEMGEMITLINQRTDQLRTLISDNIQSGNGEIVIVTDPSGTAIEVRYKLVDGEFEINARRIDQSEDDQKDINYEQANAILQKAMEEGSATDIAHPEPRRRLWKRVLQQILHIESQRIGYHEYAIPVETVSELPFIDPLQWEKMQIEIESSGAIRERYTVSSWEDYSLERTDHTWRLTSDTDDTEGRSFMVEFGTRAKMGSDPKLSGIRIERRVLGVKEAWSLHESKYQGYITSFQRGYVTGTLRNGDMHAIRLLDSLLPPRRDLPPDWHVSHGDWQNETPFDGQSVVEEMGLYADGQSYIPGFTQIIHAGKEMLKSIISSQSIVHRIGISNR